MLEKLQPFVKAELANSMRQDDIEFIYDADGELVGEIHREQGVLSQIDFYDADALAAAGIPFTGSAMLHAMVRANDVADEVDPATIPLIAHQMKEAFDDRELKLEYIVDYDANYLAVFEEVEQRYGLPIPNTGLQLAIRKDGTLGSASFMREPYSITYPEQLLSKEEARAILVSEPLVQLAIEQQEEWRYVYVPNANVYGVESDGRLKRLGEQAVYETLPEVAPVTEPLEVFLQGGRLAPNGTEDGEELFYWESTADEDDPQPVLEEPAFQRACRVLQAVVGPGYSGYQLEALHTDHESRTYRFVYCHNGVYIPDHAAEITVHQTTNQIKEVVVQRIPFAQLESLQPPIVTLEEADALAKQLVDVTLSMERIDREENLYSVVYLLEYPSSPTQGVLKCIDAYTREVSFVETGLMKVDC